MDRFWLASTETMSRYIYDLRTVAEYVLICNLIYLLVRNSRSTLCRHQQDSKLTIS
jgi:hypothetical protein